MINLSQWVTDAVEYIKLVKAGRTTDKERLDWLDQHTAFVADGEYQIGPYKVGELRKMADEGIAIDKKLQDKNICKHCGGDIRIRNPKGYCDHLYYPENCEVCKGKVKL